MDSDERRSLIRSVRQRLEGLARAGVDRIALPDAVATPPTIRKESPPLAPAKPPPVGVSLPAPTITRQVLPPPPKGGMLFDEPVLDAPVMPSAERALALATLASEVASCVRCPHLAASRTQTVFGTGLTTARLMFVGEAPGADEDRQGKPFVGRAGALLTDMINKGMGLSRDEVYIANVLKSRPPENRPPLPDEVAHCLPYLEQQIAIVRPEFLCLLGKTAVVALLETALPMNRLRGKWHRYRGIPTVVTWHPAYLLRYPAAKKDTWEDLQLLMSAMGLKGPDRKKLP
jgi:uracil-DNA glycosylase family 4